MRDVTTVERGEEVSVWIDAGKPVRLWGGSFIAADSFAVVVDLPMQQSATFPWDSTFWVEDSCGEVLSRVVVDPVLEVGFPDRE